MDFTKMLLLLISVTLSILSETQAGITSSTRDSISVYWGKSSDI